MIPTIDILFQLVIFFILACQFAVTEQFPISVPDKCTSAKSAPQEQRNILTVTIMNAASGDGIECAVGTEKLSGIDGKVLAAGIAEKLNEKLTADQRIVCLRIAKDVPFGQTQYALAGVAASSATDIQMAVMKN